MNPLNELAEASIPSPCVTVCRIAAGKCIGCGRTAEEVEMWLYLSDSERAAILARLEGQQPSS